MKVVAGAPNIRPPWFFDTNEQGEAASDIGTHLVDLVQWTLFPDRAIDYRADIKRARRAALADVDSGGGLPPRDQRAGLPEGAGAARQGRTARVLLQHARVVRAPGHPHEAEHHLGLGSAGRLRRHALRVLPRHARAHRGAADEGGQIPAGALRRSGQRRRPRRRCSRRCRRRSRRCRPTIPASASRIAAPRSTSPSPTPCASATRRISRRWRRASSSTSRDRSALPAWERPNMLAKYYVTTTGAELSRKSAAAAGATHRAALGLQAFPFARAPPREQADCPDERRAPETAAAVVTPRIAL